MLGTIKSVEKGSPVSGDTAQLASVIVPAYNHESYVRECIESIDEQTWGAVEIIVVNDGSKDGTLEATREALRRVRRPWTLVDKENGGLCNALNTGRRYATGRYLSVLASDDRILSTKLAIQVGALLADPELAAVFGDMRHMDLEGRVVRTVSLAPPDPSTLFVDFALFRASLSLQACTIDARAFDEIGGFDETLRYEDRDFLLRLLRTRRMAYVPGPVVDYRVSETGLGSKTHTFVEDLIRLYEKHADDARMVDAVGSPTRRRLRAICLRRVAATHISQGTYREGAAAIAASLRAWPFGPEGWRLVGGATAARVRSRI